MAKQSPKDLEVEVLYQRLGDRWFAFSIVNDEVFMSPVSDDQVAEAKRDPASVARLNTAIDNFEIDNFNNDETV